VSLISGALRRPLTVVVMLVALGLAGALALSRMARDIFPSLGVPTLYVAQPYGGMDPAQMEGFLTYYYEYHFLYITGIEHVESKSIQGTALIKLQFHPGTDMAQAMAETIGYVNRARAFMPPGTVPPFVMRFDAGSVPVGNLVFASDSRSVGELQDFALNRVRPLFATLPGVSAPPPFGGNQRTIVVNLKPERLRACSMAPDEVVAALAATNLVSPSGTLRVGRQIPIVPTNSIVGDIKELLRVPIRTGSLDTVFLRDVATVEDATDVPTGYALVNGRRTVYVPVTKRADASTLAVVSLVKANLGRFQSVLPEDVKVSYEFDQSPYVTRALAGLAFEGGLGALLTGLMVLLFLRDARSALIVVINIPLALLAAVTALWVSRQTLNIMTLGGLALAIGVLVDMATVTIENLHTHLGRGQPLTRAIVDSGREVALPLLVSMLCVLAVFVPSLFMTGVFAQAHLHRELVVLARENTTSREALLKVSKARFASGLVSRVDQGLAGADLAQARAEAIVRQKQLEQSLAGLWKAMGLPGRPDREVEALPGEVTAPAGTLEQDLADAARTRPEMAEAQAEAEAARAELAAAEGGHNPVLQIFATGGYLANLRSHADPGLYAVGMSLSVPLYTSGGVEADVVRARHRLAAAEARLAEVSQQVTYEVTRARLALDGLLATLEARELELRYAEDARRLAVLRYENGLSGIAEVQEALAIWLRARGSRARLTAELWQARAEWDYARGQ